MPASPPRPDDEQFLDLGRMQRFRKSTPAVDAAILLTLCGVLIADLMTPLGVAVWVFYLVPMVLSLFLWQPSKPLIVAGLTTVFITLCYTTDEHGVDPAVARLNRGFGVLTMWVVAGVAYYFIRNKIVVRTQEWLQTGHTNLNAAIAGDLPVEQVGDNALQFLAGHLNALAGTIYVDSNGVFKRAAAYAIQKGQLPEEFRPGEGLVGQAVKDAPIRRKLHT